MKFLFHTDHASFLQKRSAPENAAIRARMASHPPFDFGLGIISFHEQTIGAHAYINRARTSIKEQGKVKGRNEDNR